MIFDGDYKELGKYVRAMADMMGLRDWTINMIHDTPPEEAAADVDVIYGQKTAEIRFQKNWPHFEPAYLRVVVAHELIHCHLNPSRNVLNDMEEAIGKVLYVTAYNALTTHIKYATDGIAREWAESLPLPVKAKKKRKKKAKAA